MSISDRQDTPGEFTFPPGTTIPAGDFLILYADDPDGTTPLNDKSDLDKFLLDNQGQYEFTASETVDEAEALFLQNKALLVDLDRANSFINRKGISIPKGA